MSIDALRQEYKGDHLAKSDLNANPIEAFRDWFRLAAETSSIPEPNAMTLATVDADGNPSARIVLLKEIQDEGLVFYTNFESKKGGDIDETGKVALVFWWEPLSRQVRIEGRTKKLDRNTSKAYFDTRPRGSQLGAWASDQSRVISSKEALMDQLDTYEKQFEGVDIPMPTHWGGFLVKPEMFEFWQGGAKRLHDRIRYQKRDDIWMIDRLSP